MYEACRHIMPDGDRCESPILKDRPYCYHHDRLHRALGKSKKARKNALNLRPLEDRTSVLMALSDVVLGLANHQIDAGTAGRLLYALQIAGQIAPESPRSGSDTAIERLFIAKNGDELAPGVDICTEDDRCDSCRYATGCELKKAVKYRAEHGIVENDEQKHETEDEAKEEIEQDDEETEDDADDDDNEEDDDEEDEEEDDGGEEENDDSENENNQDGNSARRSAA